MGRARPSFVVPRSLAHHASWDRGERRVSLIHLPPSADRRVHYLSAWAETTCDLFVLTSAAFKSTMHHFPQYSKRVRASIEADSRAIDREVAKHTRNLASSTKLAKLQEVMVTDDQSIQRIWLPEDPRRDVWESLKLAAILVEVRRALHVTHVTLT